MDTKSIIINNIEYEIYKQDNDDLLLKPINTITINNLEQLSSHDFSFSSICYCKIDGELINKSKYKVILNYVYTKINDGFKIIKNTSINIKTINYKDKGFYYLEDLGISIQGVDANKCIYEIINQCIQNNIKIEIKIKLQNNQNLLINK